MKKVGIAIFVLALVGGLVVTNMFSFGRMFAWPGVHFGAVQGSGHTASDVRDVEDFHGIDVGGVFKVEVIAGRTTGVEVQADDNLLPLISTHVDDDGILHIDSERRLKSQNDIHVRVTMPDVDSLDVSGAANVTVTGLKNDGINLDASGASRIKMSGETAKLTVDVSGASKILADDLSVVNANVDASGASAVEVNVTGKLAADLSGASNVTYSGSPTSVEKKTSGASHVNAK
jgi:hypothetical protein